MHVQIKYRSLSRYLKVNKHLHSHEWITHSHLACQRIVFTPSFTIGFIFNFIFNFFSIMTWTMHGIFRFIFSSHQINQFYERQIGELDPMHRTIPTQSTIPPSLKKRKMNARLLCDMDMHRHHPLIMSTKTVHEFIALFS